MKDPINEGLLVKSWSDYLRAWISLKGPLKNPMKKNRYLLKAGRFFSEGPLKKSDEKKPRYLFKGSSDIIYDL